LKYRKIIAPVVTRWNSSYFMLDSIMKLREPLESIRDYPGLDPGNVAELIPTSEEFDVFDELLPFMEKVAQLSATLSADSYPTIHLVVDELYKLKLFLDDQLALDGSEAAFAFFVEVKKEMDKRFPKCGAGNMVYAIGHLLNPFYKGGALKIQEIDLFDKAKQFMFDSYTGHQEAVDSLLNESVIVDDLEASEDPLFQEISKFVPQASEPPPNISPLEVEWKLYESMPKPKKAVATYEVLNWWKANQAKLPKLSLCARQWLCVPVSSAPAERAFSDATNLVSCKRTKLNGDNIEMLLFIKQNIDKVNMGQMDLRTEEEVIELEKEKAVRAELFEVEDAITLPRSSSSVSSLSIMSSPRTPARSRALMSTPRPLTPMPGSSGTKIPPNNYSSKLGNALTLSIKG